MSVNQLIFSTFVLLLLLLFLPVSSLANDSIVDWQSTVSLSYPIASHTSESAGNNVYIINGSAAFQSSHSDILKSLINLNGTLQSWSSVSNLPQGLIFLNSAKSLGSIYVLGGYLDGISNVNTVYKSAFISGVSTWTPLESLPTPLRLGGSAIVGDYIYYLGGFGISDFSDVVYFAHIKPDGALDSWNTTTSLPVKLEGFGTVATDNSIIIFGGHNGSGLSDKTYQATVNLADGTLGNWIERSPLPSQIWRMGFGKLGNTIISVGGAGNGGLLSNVYYTTVDNSGAVGPWTNSTHPLPQAICCGSLASNGMFAYYSGGVNDSGYLDKVYFTQLATTPTPTMTPTPTPALPTTKVLLLPGLGASWNPDALINCKDSNYSGDWTLNPLAIGDYAGLQLTLNLAGYHVIQYNYDWRKDVRDHNSEINNLLNTALTPGEKVDVVAHSMGGLLGRSYMQAYPVTNRFDKFITAGTPHQGTAYFYPAWSGDRLESDDMLFRFAATVIINRCSEFQEYQAVRNHFPAAQNLLPTFDYLYSQKNRSLIPVSSMQAQNNFLNQPFPLANSQITLGTLSGTGLDTLQGFSVIGPNDHEASLGLWSDGKITSRNSVKDGDGTILVTSSQLPQATNYTISEKHEKLLANPGGIQDVLLFLGNANSSISPINSSDGKSALIIMSNGGEFTLNGQRSNHQIIAVTNPGKKHYLIDNMPISGSIFVAKLQPNGVNSWSEYHLDNQTKTLDVIGED